MTTIDATYDPADNKIRVRTSALRFDRETYARLRTAGFIWAPKQDLMVAPKWTPEREDLAIELAGELGDEDTSLVDRAEERADRFEGYSERREADAKGAEHAANVTAQRFEGGQPILIGHHSQRRAEKDAERIKSGLRKAAKMWETSAYWIDRAAGAIRHAKYKERPDVRARRIKTLEAEKRGIERDASKAKTAIKLWGDCLTLKKKSGDAATPMEGALFAAERVGGVSRCYTLAEYPRQPPASQYEGQVSMWSALTDGVVTPEQAQALAIPVWERSAARAARWLAHLENRLAYERAMMADAGGIATDRKTPEKGGAIRCLFSPGHGRGWSTIQKVNKVSVTILDSWGNGGRSFTRTIPFDDVRAIMSAAEVEAARAAGTLAADHEGLGFYLTDAPAPAPRTPTPPNVARERAAELKQAAKAGVKVVSAPQLFPTPHELAARMVREAEIQPGDRVLEPSAGTGNLLRAIADYERILDRAGPAAHVVAVEISQPLAVALPKHLCAHVAAVDFLSLPVNDPTLGEFDRIVMNPPFVNASDVAHIRHAFQFLRPGGRLVALCADGPKQRETLKPWAEELGGTYESLPPGTFKEQGTSVNVALIVVDAPAEEAPAAAGGAL